MRKALQEDDKPAILIWGDAQARGVAIVLERIDAIAQSYDVLFRHNVAGSGEFAKGDLERCAFFLTQSGGTPGAPHLSRACKSLTFPALRLSALWPLVCASPFGHARQGSEAESYPFGDTFVISSIDRGIPADEIMRTYSAPVWNTAWPDLDAIFEREKTALLDLDAKCDVKIGSFVLKHFRKRRLFWAPTAPANELLCELTYRVLHACFGRDGVDRDAVRTALSSISPRDVMAHVSVPLHPAVASHFMLEWYDGGERYPAFEGSRSFEEYYRGMIAYLCAQHAEGSYSAIAPKQ